MQWIHNIKLETGYETDSKGITKTLTQMVSMKIEDGIITEISKDNKVVDNSIDAKGNLMLPSFADNHIHLDKGHYGGPWEAVVPLGSVAERIKEEQAFLKDFLPHTKERAQALIDLVCGNGATFLRVQVNVDPTIHFENLKLVQEVLEENKDRLDYEIVVFPQHGTLDTEAEHLLSQALALEGVDVIGGLDPATLDLDVEKSLKTTFDLAKKYGKQIDFHLHDHNALGIFEIERMIQYTHDYELEGRVQISHAYALGDVSKDEVRRIAKLLKKADIAINTTAPIDTPAPNIPILLEEGVHVSIINDNINDHWSPFGSGDLLQRASRGAEIFGMVDEKSLSTMLPTITRGQATIRDNKQVWPQVGDKANAVFIPAESSAHAIARIPQKRIVLFKGKIVSGQFQ